MIIYLNQWSTKVDKLSREHKPKIRSGMCYNKKFVVADSKPITKSKYCALKINKSQEEIFTSG